MNNVNSDGTVVSDQADDRIFEERADEMVSHIKKRSVLTLLTLISLCTAGALLTGAIILIYQYKQGIPYSLPVSLALSVLFGAIIPFIVTRIYCHFRTQVRYGALLVFLACNLLLSLGIGLAIF